MTFASDTTRILFHQLPTATQMSYAEWETKLSLKNQFLQIDSVMQHGTISEVVIRITDHMSDAVLADCDKL